MSDGEQQSENASITLTDDVDRIDFQLLQKRSQIIGHLFVCEGALSIRGFSMRSIIGSDDVVRTRKISNLAAHAVDGPSVSMDEQQKWTGAVGLVVHTNAIYLRKVTGRRVLPIRSGHGPRLLLASTNSLAPPSNHPSHNTYLNLH